MPDRVLRPRSRFQVQRHSVSELVKKPSRAAREQGARRAATRHIIIDRRGASTAQRSYRDAQQVFSQTLKDRAIIR